MKKLMKKKNNKGFSLVELIVVVLILGILAVALAPQVMRWVDKAKENSDKNKAKDIESAINIAISEAQSDGWTVGTGLTFKIENGSDGLDKIAGTKLEAPVKKTLKLSGSTPKYPKTQAGDSFTVIIDTEYSVTITYPGMPTN